MKFTISRDALLKPLQVVSGAVERRTTLPILSNVLLQVSEESLRLTGTDLEVELVSEVSLEQATPGDVTIPCEETPRYYSLVTGRCRTSVLQATIKQLYAREKPLFIKYIPESDYPNIDEWESEVHRMEQVIFPRFGWTKLLSTHSQWKPRRIDLSVWNGMC